MTEAQFELMLGAFREQHNELRAIHEAALGKLWGIAYALYFILGINLIILPGWPGWPGLPCEMYPFGNARPGVLANDTPLAPRASASGSEIPTLAPPCDGSPQSPLKKFSSLFSSAHQH